jgi:hypothetical protein
MADSVSWSTPVFSQIPSTSDDDLWISVSEDRKGVKVIILALLNGYGEGRSVTKYVANTLASRVINELDSILAREKFEEEEAPPTKDCAVIDDEVHAALKKAFRQLDEEFYEETIRPFLENSKGSNDAEKSAHLFDTTGGCSVIMAVFLNSILYVATCGNSAGILCKNIGEEMAIFPVSDINETIELNVNLPMRCFGDYARKTEITGSREITAEPYVAGRIPLNQTFRFVVFVSATTTAAIRKRFGNEQAKSLFASMLLDEIKHRPLEESLRQVMDNIGDETTDEALLAPPTLSALLINLENDIPSDPVHVSDESPNGSNKSESPDGLTEAMVESVVDWSDFDTHELRDTVLAKIESLKQHYRERKTLSSIAEHF